MRSSVAFCIFICVENDYYLVENKTLMNFMKINMQINGEIGRRLGSAPAAAAAIYRVRKRARCDDKPLLFKRNNFR